MQSQTPANAERRLLSASQVAKVCGCTRSYVHVLTAKGVLPQPVFIYEGSHPRWWSDELTAELDKLKARQAADIKAARERAQARQRGEKISRLNPAVQS